MEGSRSVVTATTDGAPAEFFDGWKEDGVILGFLLKVHDPSTGRISEYELRDPWPAKVAVVPGDLILGMPTSSESIRHHIEIESFIQNWATTPKPCSSCGSYELGPAERFRILVPPKDFWENGGYLTVTATDPEGSSAQIMLEVAIEESK